MQHLLGQCVRHLRHRKLPALPADCCCSQAVVVCWRLQGPQCPQQPLLQLLQCCCLPTTWPPDPKAATQEHPDHEDLVLECHHRNPCQNQRGLTAGGGGGGDAGRDHGCTQAHPCRCCCCRIAAAAAVQHLLKRAVLAHPHCCQAALRGLGTCCCRTRCLLTAACNP